MKGRDVLGCAQTGTGKTAAFVIPTIDFLGSQPGPAAPGKPYALVLAPTRELAIQIGKSIETYGKHLKLRTTLVFGGVNQNSQVQALRRGADILVATPGRLLDLMEQGHVELSQLEIFVLDEADRMLDMGFLPDLKRIIRRLPEQRQSLFFSATLEPKVTELAKSLLFEPAIVNVTPKTRSVEKIRQQMLLVENGEKLSRLKTILAGDDVQLSIVFTRTKRAASALERKLQAHGIDAAAIHGNKSQNARERALGAFRQGQLKVLVATDVAARGIDVTDVSHVINYDLPTEPESYVHRIGRTGRAGADGIAITFYTSEQRQEAKAIERFAGVELLTDAGSGAARGVREASPNRSAARASGATRPATDPARPSSRKGRRRRSPSQTRQRDRMQPV